MSKTVKGAGRSRYNAQQAKHSQRGPLPEKTGQPYTAEEHTADLVAAAQPRSAKIAAPMAPPSSKAGAFAEKAEELGWAVKRKRGEGFKTVECQRGDEVLTISWTDNQVFVPDAFWSVPSGASRRVKNAAEAYRLLARSPEDALAAQQQASAPRAQRTPATAKAPTRRLNFDPKTTDPVEVLAAVQGREVTWYNSLTEDWESARVPAGNRTKMVRGKDGQQVEVHVEDRTVVSPSQSEATFGRLILAFCDPFSGYRACFVDAIQRVK